MNNSELIASHWDQLQRNIAEFHETVHQLSQHQPGTSTNSPPTHRLIEPTTSPTPRATPKKGGEPNEQRHRRADPDADELPEAWNAGWWNNHPSRVKRWLKYGYIMVISWLYQGYIVVISWLHQGYIVVISWLKHGISWLNRGWTIVEPFRILMIWDNYSLGTAETSGWICFKAG